MWNMKCSVISVITGTTGIVSKSLKKSENNTRTTVNTFSAKNTVLGTSHIIRKVLESEDLKPKWWGSPLAQEEMFRGRENL
jgi:hypothetical protein